jgi:hypothetical protein
LYLFCLKNVLEALQKFCRQPAEELCYSPGWLGVFRQHSVGNLFMNFAPCTIPPAIELARIINKYWCKLFATGALFVLAELCDKSDLQTQSKAGRESLDYFGVRGLKKPAMVNRFYCRHYA